MSRPLKINNTTPKSLREMSDSDLSYLVYRVLKKFASDDTDAGSLTSDTGDTSIGAFVDTKRVNTVGSHPVNPASLDSTTTTIYQNRSTTAINSTRPVHWESSLNATQELSNGDFNTSVVNLCLNNLIAGGIGSYRLGTAAPSGGTWVSKFSIIDSTITGNTTYYIWRKTDDGVPTAIRPIKFDSTLGGLREMSDADLDTIVDALRERIRTTGIGQYALQVSAPGTGTWLDLGSISDTRHVVNDVNYAGGQTYLGDYFNENAVNYVGNYFNENAINYFNENAIAYYNENAIGYVRTFGGRNFGTYYGGANYFGGANYAGGQTYFGDYAGGVNYVGDYFNENAINYAGQTVRSTKETVITERLWLRIA